MSLESFLFFSCLCHSLLISNNYEPPLHARLLVVNHAHWSILKQRATLNLTKLNVLRILVGFKRNWLFPIIEACYHNRSRLGKTSFLVMERSVFFMPINRIEAICRQRAIWIGFALKTTAISGRVFDWFEYGLVWINLLPTLFSDMREYTRGYWHKSVY